MAAIMLMASLFFVAGCTPEDDSNNGGGNNGNNPINGLPVLTTSQVSDINSTTVTGGGVITSDGGSAITERGLCWGTQPNPDVSGTHAVVGSGMGTFTYKITNLEPNKTYHVRAYAINSSGVGYGSDITFTTLDHGYVDLGLPSGTMWATCNVGATTTEGYGDYFAWGETQSKEYYDWSTYKYCNGSYNQLTKYCNQSDYGYNGFTDNLTVLQPSDDVATANWGNGWCMPTEEEWRELYENTSNTWTTQNGVNGRLFTANNGNSLFLPAAGDRWENELFDAGSFGHYLSSALDKIDPYNACYFSFGSGHASLGHFDRSQGRSVRAVRSAK